MSPSALRALVDDPVIAWLEDGDVRGFMRMGLSVPRNEHQSLFDELFLVE